MYDDVDDFDDTPKNVLGLVDRVRGKLGDRFSRLELADHLAPKKVQSDADACSRKQELPCPTALR